MRNPGKNSFALLLPLAFALAACGGAPDDGQAPAPEAAPVVDEAAPQPADATPVPDPDVPPPELPTDEHGMPEPWAIAAQMGAAMGAMAEGCGLADAGNFGSLDADARRHFQSLGADMDAFEALWEQTYAAVRREFAAGTDAQRAEACAELEELEQRAMEMEQP